MSSVKRILFYTLQGDGISGDRRSPDNLDIIELVDAKKTKNADDALLEAEQQVLASASKRMGIQQVSSFEEWQKTFPDVNVWWRFAADLRPLSVVYDGGYIGGFIDLGMPHTMIISGVDESGTTVTVASEYDRKGGILKWPDVMKFLESLPPRKYEIIPSLVIFDLGQGSLALLDADTDGQPRVEILDKKSKPKTMVTSG